MKTLIKKAGFLITVCAASIIAGAGIICTNSLNASADNIVNNGLFEMEEAVSLKLNGDGGLRFRVKMDNTIVNDIVTNDVSDQKKLHFAITDFDLIDDVIDYVNEGGNFATLKEESVVIIIDVDENKIYNENNVFYANGVVSSIDNDVKISKNYVALAYISYGDEIRLASCDGKQTTDADFSISKVCGNIYDVLSQAVLDTTNNYVDEIFGNNSYNWFGGDKYPIVIYDNADYVKFLSKIDLFENKSIAIRNSVTNYSANDFTGKNINVALKYNITYKNGDEILATDAVYYGETPVYSGKTPFKQATEVYEYAFSNWEVVKAEDGFIYNAIFMPSYVNYTVTFKKENGEVVSTKTDYHYGDTIVFPADEIKASDETYTYEFNGWNAAETVVKNVEYTATFTPTYINYTITFIDGDGEVIDTKIDYHYGDKITVPTAIPTKTQTEKYKYTFSEWDSEVVEVSASKTYTATFTQSLVEYTITWKNADGTTLNTTSVEYGEVPSLADPVDFETLTTKYETFTGWTPELVETTKDAEYTAMYQEEIIIGNGISKTNDVYNMYGAIWTGGTSFSYTYTSYGQYVSSVVYSVEISSVDANGNPIAIAPSGDAGIVGIVINQKDGGSAVIGINAYGIVGKTFDTQTPTSLGMARRYDRGDGARWDFATNANSTYAMDGTVATRTLTIVIINDNLYIISEGMLIKELALNNDTYINKFSSGATYQFGIFANNIDTNVSKTTIKLDKENYGQDAIKYIKNNNDIFNWETWSAETANIIRGEEAQLLMKKTSAGAVIQNGLNGTNGYYYLDGSSDTVVLSANFTVDRLPDINGNEVYSSGVGFTICGDTLTNGTTQSYQYYATGASLQGFPDVSEGTFAVKSGAVFTSNKLTVSMNLVISGGKVYVYIDGILVSGNMCYSVGGGTRYTMPANISSLLSGTTYRVGFATHRLGSAVATINNIVYKTGAEAKTEIGNNTLYGAIA